MPAIHQDITVHPQRGSWVLLFIPLVVAAFALEMSRQEIKAIWWVPPLAVFSFIFLAKVYSTPNKIVFSSGARTMDVEYRFGRQVKRYAFDELLSIRSFIKLSGENDAYVLLEVQLKNGDQVTIKTENPSWDDSALIGLSGCREPEGIKKLREQIASITAIDDLGFC